MFKNQFCESCCHEVKMNKNYVEDPNSRWVAVSVGHGRDMWYFDLNREVAFLEATSHSGETDVRGMPFEGPLGQLYGGIGGENFKRVVDAALLGMPMTRNYQTAQGRFRVETGIRPSAILGC
jgi:hypothetical protein